MKKVLLALSISTIFLASCSSFYVADRQNESSGLIGCHPKEIGIEANDFSGLTWTATCKNKKFYCNKNNAIVSCKEAL